jgi:hypothetical protein
VSTAGSSFLMSRTDDIVELLTSLAHLGFDRPHRSYLILLSSPPLSSSLQCSPTRCSLVRLNSSISHFILLLGLAFCRRRVWCRPYHLLFVCNNVIYFSPPPKHGSLAAPDCLLPHVVLISSLYALFICHLPVPFIPSDVSPSIDIVLDLASSHLPRLVRS